MELSHQRVARFHRMAWICLLVLLHGSCGTGSGTGQTDIVLSGGVLRPHAPAYSLAEQGGIVLPGRFGELPSAVDLRQDGIVPPIQNQRYNSCVGWALGYYLMSALEARHRRNEGDILDMSNHENWFSPDYLYSQRDRQDEWERVALQRERALLDFGPQPAEPPRCAEIDDPIGCMRPERALQILMAGGCCLWDWMCDGDGADGFRTCTPAMSVGGTGSSRGSYHLAASGATVFTPRCYVRFGELDELSQDTVGRLKQWLHRQGTPVAMVARMTNGWVTYRGENRVEAILRQHEGRKITEERGVCLDAGGRDLGSQHMMTIIGYDENFPNPSQFPNLPAEQVGSFLIANQWGTKWGDQGTMWIPCSELKKIWIGAYGLVRLDWENNRLPDDACACAQGPTGEWNCISRDGTDVPANLTPVPGSTIQPPPLRLVCTAAPLGMDELPAGNQGCEIASNLHDPGTVIQHGAVGGFHEGENIVDTADWFYFTLTADAETHVELRLESSSIFTTTTGVVPTHRVVGVELTTTEYERLGTRDPDTGTVSATLGGGTYLVKVHPRHLDQYDNVVDVDGSSTPTPRIQYQLTVRAGPPPPASPLRSELTNDEQTIDEGDLVFYKLETRGHTVINLRPTANARLQIVTGTPSESLVGRHPVHCHVVGAEGRAMTFPPVSEQVLRSDLYIGVRNLGAGGATYVLTAHVEETGESIPLDLLTAGDTVDMEAIQSMWRFGEGAEFSFQMLLRPDTIFWREFVIELGDYFRTPSLVFTDRNGAPVDLATKRCIHTGAGRTYLCIEPGVQEDELWGRAVDGEMNPLIGCAVRVRRLVSLQDGPEIGAAYDFTDGNDSPPEADPLALDDDEGVASSIGRVTLVGSNIEGVTGQRVGLDYWDYYRIDNTSETDRAVTVELERVQYAGEGTALMLRAWSGSRDAVEATDGLDGDDGSDRLLSVTVQIKAGETAIILVTPDNDQHDAFQFPVHYELRAR